MDVLVVGLNHHSAPVWIRERVAFASWVGAAREVADRVALAESIVLSTCNRVEAYAATPCDETEDAAERLLALFADRASMPADVLRQYVYVYRGVDAARHLARVAAGMDSMVIGETQIVAQIKRAVEDARRDGVMGRLLDRLVCNAFAAGKRARPLLPVGLGFGSVAEAGVHAIGGVASLADRSVVVIGAGDTAGDLLRALNAARPRRLVIVNRTLERALPLAARHGAAVASWEALGVVVADADVVFACTSSATPVVLPEHLALGAPRPRRLVDLGVPRNVAPSITDVPDTRLIDVDSLAGWRHSSCPAADSPEPDTSAAEAEVARWVERFAGWLRTERVLPTITRIRRGADTVRDLEVERALARLGAAAGPRERAIVRALASRLVNKLLHHPLSALSGAPDADDLAGSARRLFALDAPR